MSLWSVLFDRHTFSPTFAIACIFPFRFAQECILCLFSLARPSPPRKFANQFRSRHTYFFIRILSPTRDKSHPFSTPGLERHTHPCWHIRIFVVQVPLHSGPTVQRATKRHRHLAWGVATSGIRAVPHVVQGAPRPQKAQRATRRLCD